MESLTDIIVEYTKEALQKTALGLYIEENYVEQKIYQNIRTICFDDVLNFESPKMVDGILFINPKLFENNNTEYVKEILTSFGLYSVINNSKKYNPVNDMLATYFSALSVRGDNYRSVSSLNENYYSFLNHNLIYSNQISIFHELIGEDAMAKLVSKIDKKHSFYDNLYKLFNYMKIPNILNRREFYKLEGIMEKTYYECNSILQVDNAIKPVKKAYPKFNMLLTRFSDKFSNGVSLFLEFYRKTISSKFNVMGIKKKYGLDISDINVTEEELVGLKRILNLFESSLDFGINSYDDIYLKCNEYLKLNAGLLSDMIQNVSKKQNLVDGILLRKFVLPVVKKYGMNNVEKAKIQSIFPNVRKDKKIKKKIK